MRIQPETTQTVQEVEDDDTGAKTFRACRRETNRSCLLRGSGHLPHRWLAGTAPHDDNEAAAEEWRGGGEMRQETNTQIHGKEEKKSSEFRREVFMFRNVSFYK